LVAPAWCFRAAPLQSAAELVLADKGERGAELFVLTIAACETWRTLSKVRYASATPL
jgi:hypothetical protein